MKSPHDALVDDIRRATEREFTVPETADGRPCLVVGPEADRPVMVPMQAGTTLFTCFRPDYPSAFTAGSRVTVEAIERGGIAYVWVTDSPIRARARREMWWRQA